MWVYYTIVLNSHFNSLNKPSEEEGPTLSQPPDTHKSVVDVGIWAWLDSGYGLLYQILGWISGYCHLF